MSHKSEDYKISAVKYYLDSNKTQEEVKYNEVECSIVKLIYFLLNFQTSLYVLETSFET